MALRHRGQSQAELVVLFQARCMPVMGGVQTWWREPGRGRGKGTHQPPTLHREPGTSHL